MRVFPDPQKLSPGKMEAARLFLLLVVAAEKKEEGERLVLLVVEEQEAQLRAQLPPRLRR